MGLEENLHEQGPAEFPIQTIGRVRSPLKSLDQCPHQGLESYSSFECFSMSSKSHFSIASGP